MNIPNVLTIIRIFFIPIIVICYITPFPYNHWAAGAIFALAGFTDLLDGYLARKLKQMSQFGAFLDPVADKLMVTTALVLVVGESHLPYLALPAAIIVGREIAVSALREWMAELGKRTNVAVTTVAKYKTLLQMGALTVLLIYSKDLSIWFGILGYFMLSIAAGLTLWTMYVYLAAAWPDLMENFYKANSR